MLDEETSAIKSRLGEYLESLGVDINQAEGPNTVCPIRDHGHNTPCFHYYPNNNRWTCFSCNSSGDIFDLYAAMNKVSNAEAIRDLKILYGTANADNLTSFRYSSNDNPSSSTSNKHNEQTKGKRIMTIEESRKHLDDPQAMEYLKRRGIGLETARTYGLGFCPNWRSENATERVPTSPRLIIPTEEGSYLARDIRPEESIPENARQYCKQKSGPMHIFNVKALDDTSRPCFVVEGEIDALSILECGQSALALGSTAGINAFLTLLKTRKESGTQPSRLIIALDNDAPGKEATAKLTAGLTNLEMNYTSADVETLFCNHKDANEALVSDRHSFASRLESLVNARASRYRQTHSIVSFRETLFDPSNLPARFSTGFPDLDLALGGSTELAPSGLYVLGANSSLGKSTLALQMADSIARSGQDVLFFSLEMSKSQLAAKSISRISYETALATYGRNASGHAFTSDDILQIATKDSSRGIANNQDISGAFKEYFDNLGEHLFIMDAPESTWNVHEIATAVQSHIRETGMRPVAIVDYLQILGIGNTTICPSDKASTDAKISALKAICKQHGIPVIVISSLNRASYNRAIGLESFKESGSIEYTADVILALQPRGLREAWNGNEDTASAMYANLQTSNERDLELVVLKNRMGEPGACLPSVFIPRFNFFDFNVK